MHDVSAERRRVPPIVVDLLVAAFVLGIGLASREQLPDGEIARFSRDFDLFNLVLIFGQAVPLILRRRYPATVFALVTAAWVIDRALDYPGTLAGAGVAVAMHALGSELSSRRSTLVGWGSVAGLTTFTILGALTLDSVSLDDVVFTCVVLSLPLVLGKEVHTRRERFEAMRRRVELAERDREERAAEAVRRERARIARELHDVVAHQMAVMTLQAEGARRLARDADPRVGEALDTIRRAGHDALAEMRRMVGLLRTEGTDSAPDLAPQPGLGDLERLVDQMAEAGLDVEVQTHGAPRDLPSGIDLSAYRIIQESLTNTLKHGGPGVRAVVDVTYGRDQVDVRIVDDGAGATSDANGGGHGLVGMRERVALVDGRLEVGPAPDGGYRVHAVLPVVPA